jgi:putative nucleotidyltransferase with HDIG domain
LTPPTARVSTRSARSVESLAEELQRLPVHNATALRVLALLDDPDVLIADLGRLIQTDSALAARVLKLANSSFFGLRGEITSVDRAVMAIGLSTVRTFTLAAAFDLFNDKGASLPENFWSHSLATASGAMTLAKRVRLPASDAFSAGLLHDLGTALLHRHDAAVYELHCLEPELRGDDLLMAERLAFGMDHAEAGAMVLATCHFPKTLVDCLAGHHHSVRRKRLGKPDLVAVVAVADRIIEDLAAGVFAPSVVTQEGLEALGLDGGDYDWFVREHERVSLDTSAFAAAA